MAFFVRVSVMGGPSVSESETEANTFGLHFQKRFLTVAELRRAAANEWARIKKAVTPPPLFRVGLVMGEGADGSIVEDSSLVGDSSDSSEPSSLAPMTSMAEVVEILLREEGSHDGILGNPDNSALFLDLANDCFFPQERNASEFADLPHVYMTIVAYPGAQTVYADFGRLTTKAKRNFLDKHPPANYFAGDLLRFLVAVRSHPDIESLRIVSAYMKRTAAVEMLVDWEEYASDSASASAFLQNFLRILDVYLSLQRPTTPPMPYHVYLSHQRGRGYPYQIPTSCLVDVFMEALELLGAAVRDGPDFPTRQSLNFREKFLLDLLDTVAKNIFAEDFFPGLDAGWAGRSDWDASGMNRKTKEFCIGVFDRLLIIHRGEQDITGGGDGSGERMVEIGAASWGVRKVIRLGANFVLSGCKGLRKFRSVLEDFFEAMPEDLGASWWRAIKYCG